MKKRAGILILIPIFLAIIVWGFCSFKEYFGKTESVTSPYEGFYLRASGESFFAASKNTNMFSENELIRMIPYDSTVSFDELSNGDQIKVYILTVGDLNPRVMEVYQLVKLEDGNIADLDDSVIEEIEKLGYHLEES